MTFNQALKEAKKLAKGDAYAVRREVFFYSNGDRSTEVQVYIAGMSEIFTGKTYEEAVKKAADAVALLAEEEKEARIRETFERLLEEGAQS